MEWNLAINNFQEYLLLEKGLSQNTQLAYIRDIKKLIKFTEHDTSITPYTIDRFLIQDFIYDFAKKSSSAKSQARVISSLKSFFKFLQIEEKRQDNPAELLESPKIGLYLPDVLSHEEVLTIIQSIDLSQSEGERNRTIIETLYGCGLRVSELINLRLSDLYLDENFIRVIGKGNKQRLVPVSDWTIKYINLYKDSIRIHLTPKPKCEDILFLNRRGGQLTREMIFIIIKNIAEKAGIKKKVSPHTFRHSFATVLLKNGADLRSIQQMLGHESITTTEIYTHLDNQQLRDTIEKYHPFSIKKG
ncbi:MULTISPECIES: site-specific tyrosine recombinase XerD [unclassified Apibacter]|uniref:site-specific tyrosine recombinase XerD n=1 Tax=unclassified Apibacter TaxID=2630820 RepID=UPI00132C4692|nr:MULTISPECIES: site-specific tyrosine recombinase XerD [unclassified Apibacter]MCX8676616.1 site-specific tyrosine recombinase XerD [Apibacter sp. B3919]MXO24074.1 site-specific tyrosine recombinase XerD [Apibacter sp. B3924]MXO26245.1 site-specific tyrosine recombinase XerD [Apibacter sp. B3813]MXO28196.1 site-specific tyrosine recombinase XerD [Apibacter sp. B3913]MXO30150.1 site-specific tyrosine recombinase XerD [Apibacter sp. B3912]